MDARRFIGGLLALALLGGACSGDFPAEYTLLDEPLVEVPQAGGSCTFPYQSQAVSIDPSSGESRRTVEVPFDPAILESEPYFLIPHSLWNQPSGVLALDASLDFAWQSQFPGYLRGGSTGYNGGIVSEDGSLLMWGGAGSNRSRIVIADAATGEQIMSGSFPGLFTPPQMVEGMLVAVTVTDEAIGIDPTTMETVWKLPLGVEHAGPSLAEGERVYVAGWDGVLRGLSPSGELELELQTSLEHLNGVALIEDSIAYVTGSGPAGGSRVGAVDLVNQVELWNQPASSDPWRVVRIGDLAVFGLPRKGIRAVQPRTGEIVWQFFGKAARMLGASAAGDHVFATFDRNNRVFRLAAIEAAPTDSLTWHVELPGRPTLDPVVVGDLVLVGGFLGDYDATSVEKDAQGWLHAYSIDSGQRAWATVIREAPRHSVVSGEFLVVVTADEALFCD